MKGEGEERGRDRQGENTSFSDTVCYIGEDIIFE